MLVSLHLDNSAAEMPVIVLLIMGNSETNLR